MINELTVKIGEQNRKIFLQDGFYLLNGMTSHIHRHNYAEIHIISGGNVSFNIGESLYSTSNGNILAIPGGVFHGCAQKEAGALHTAFQIDCDIREFSSFIAAEATVKGFFDEIEMCEKTHDYTKVAAYITLFGSHFCGGSLSVQPITDYGFLIQEFFSNRYSENIRLCDLAEVLHLSERQTERIVIEYTGNTFREELAYIRTAIAKRLLKTSDMPLGKVARYVGYNSYAGFWKAMTTRGTRTM